MIAQKEEIKDWISKGYDQGAQYLFILKDQETAGLRPYWVEQGHNVEVVRVMISDSGETIVNELNYNVKLLLLNRVL